MTIIYLDRNCVEIQYQKYRKYDYLELDFIFLYDLWMDKNKGKTIDDWSREVTLEVRKHLHSILLSYKDYIWKSKAFQRDEYCRRFWDYIENPEDDYTIPIMSGCGIYVALGNTVMFIKLPREVINSILNDWRLVDWVKDWCNKQLSKLGYEPLEPGEAESDG